MPELPEVETIARGLAPQVTGRTILGVEAVRPSVLNVSGPDLADAVVGRTIEGVRRRAKLLILDLDRPLHLVFHLKMTGRVWAGSRREVPQTHTHVLFDLGEDTTLYFRDVRRFGYCRVLSTPALQDWDFFAGLGPEPLECGCEDFLKRIRGRRARIKGLLLDQRVVAGLGNIYVDEALHLAGIHPARKAADLSGRRLADLHRAVTTVLSKAIDLGGSTFRDFLNASGQPGNYQDEFMAYGRSGQPCKKCKATLKAVRVAGRSSTFCPCCQPAGSTGKS
ncbi:MAG: bifunctional DNA-formamidopyrimidine glycosylase/DNA-(apurinic or apyrimidinic site) lyase [Desulfohalobiaceae bacterium]